MYLIFIFLFLLMGDLESRVRELKNEIQGCLEKISLKTESEISFILNFFEKVLSVDSENWKEKDGNWAIKYFIDLLDIKDARDIIVEDLSRLNTEEDVRKFSSRYIFSPGITIINKEGYDIRCSSLWNEMEYRRLLADGNDIDSYFNEFKDYSGCNPYEACDVDKINRFLNSKEDEGWGRWPQNDEW